MADDSALFRNASSLLRIWVMINLKEGAYDDAKIAEK